MSLYNQPGEVCMRIIIRDGKEMLSTRARDLYARKNNTDRIVFYEGFLLSDNIVHYLPIIPVGNAAWIEVDIDKTDVGICWSKLLWQLFFLKRQRPGLKLTVTSFISDPLWFRMLFSLGFMPHRIKNENIKHLTLMEAKVLLYLLDGMSAKNVAEHICRDTKTVSSYKCKALRKMGLNNKADIYHLGALLHEPVKLFPTSQLTREEQRTLCYLLRYGCVSTIAQKLGKSIKTVSTQKRSLMKKLDITHDFALFFVRKGDMGR
jgi:DNA-binding NarL/FixJ family response regulator